MARSSANIRRLPHPPTAGAATPVALTPAGGAKAAAVAFVSTPRPLALDPSTPQFGIGGISANKITSNAFSPPAGSLIIVIANAAAFQPFSAASITDSLGVHLNWAKIGEALNGGGGAMSETVWAADCLSAQAGMTVTASFATASTIGGNDATIAVFVYTGAKTVVGQVGGFNSQNALGTPSIALTAAAAGSAIIGGWVNWTNNTAPTIPGGQTATFNGNSFLWNDPSGSYYWCQQQSAFTAAPGSVTLNATAPTGVALSGVAVEVEAAYVTSVPALTATASAATAAANTVTATSKLTATAGAAAQATVALGAPALLVATAQAKGQAQATVTTTAPVVSAASATCAAIATVTTTAPLTAAAQARSAATAATTAAAALTATAQAATQAQATTTTNAPLVATAQAQAQATVTVAVPQDIATLVDNFPGSSIDTTKWAVRSTGLRTPSVASNQLVLPVVGGGFSTVSSLVTWRLTNSGALVKITPPPGSDGGSRRVEFALAISSVTDPFSDFVELQPGSLVFEYGWINEIRASYYTTGGVRTYAPSTAPHTGPVWLRIRELSGLVYWDYSDDGAAWTNLWSVADPIATGALYVFLKAGFTGEDNPGTAYAEKFNLAGVNLGSAAAQSVTAASALVTVVSTLVPVASAATQATAALTAPAALTVSAQGKAQAQAAVTVAASLIVTAQATAQAQAAVTAIALLTAPAQAATAAAAPLTATALLTATAQAAAQGTATAITSAVLVPAAQARAQAQAQTSALALLSAVAQTTATATAQLAAPAQVAPTAQATAQATATVVASAVPFLTPVAQATAQVSASATAPALLAATAQLTARAKIAGDVTAPSLLTATAQATTQAGATVRPAVSLIQTAIIGGGGSDGTGGSTVGRIYSFSAPTTSGNTLVVGINSYGLDDVIPTLASVTDGGTNTFTIPAGAQNTNLAPDYGLLTAFAYVENCVGKSTHTITVVIGTTSNPWTVLSLWELSPCTFDQATKASGTGLSVSAGTLTPASNGSYSFLVANFDGVPAGGWSHDTGWTDGFNNSAGNGETYSGSIPQGTAAALNYHVTAGSSGGSPNVWGASGISFVSGASGPLVTAAALLAPAAQATAQAQATVTATAAPLLTSTAQARAQATATATAPAALTAIAQATSIAAAQTTAAAVLVPTAAATAAAGSYQVIAADDFNRANGGLGTGWTAFVGGTDTPMAIVSNQAKASAASGVWSGSYRTDTYGNDQFAQLDVAATPGPGDWIGVTLRTLTNGQNGYRFIYFNNAGTYELRIGTRASGTGGTLTTLSLGSSPLPIGTTLRLVVIGNFFRLFQNGVQVLTATDSTFLAGGAPGLITFNSTASITGAADNYLSGNAVLTAPVPITAASLLSPVAGASTQAAAPITAAAQLTGAIAQAASQAIALITSGGAAIAPSAQAAMTATAQATARALIVATAQAAGSAVAQASALTRFTASGQATAAAQATVTTTAPLVPSASATTQATAAVTSVGVQNLFPVAQATASAASALTAAARLAASASATTAASAALTTAAQLAPVAQAISSASVAAVGTQAWLTPSASASTQMTLTLFVPGVAFFTASASARAQATATVTAPQIQFLTPTAQAATAATGSSTARALLSATAQAATQATSLVTYPVKLTPTASAQASATAASTANALLSASANARASAATSTTAAAQLAPQASSTTTASAVVTSATLLAPTAQAAMAASAFVVVPVRFVANATCRTQARLIVTAPATAVLELPLYADVVSNHTYVDVVDLSYTLSVVSPRTFVDVEDPSTGATVILP